MYPSPDQNPYATPVAVGMPPLPQSVSSYYFRDGDLLVIRDGAVLPSRCVHTNQDVGPEDWTKRTRMTWTPPWVFVLILVNILVLLIVAMCVNKKAWLTYSLSRQARGRLIKRRSIAFLVFVAGVAASIGSGVYIEGDLAVWLAVLCAVISLVALFVLALTSAISVKKHTDGWFSIKGCSPEFLNSL